EHAAYTCLKLLTNGARAWLAIEQPGPPPPGDVALNVAAARLPDLEPALDRALTLRARLDRPADVELLSESLDAFTRLSDRVATRLRATAEAAGEVEVNLVGTPPASASALPLVDWRGVVAPMLPDDVLVLMPGDPGDRAALAGAVQAAGAWRYGGLLAGNLLVLAAGEHWTRSFLRGAACPATDP